MKTSPDFTTLPEFYKTYVNYVQDLDMLEALQSSSKETVTLLQQVDEKMGEHRYAPEKWSVKELLCHIMDAERIFAYRALRFARNDATPLSSFEENDYALQANAHARTFQQLLTEMRNLRTTSIDLFASFTSEMLQRKGVASNKTISVINLGYIIAGHEKHHVRILSERYLNK
jgi:hypothetical protein